MTETETQDIKMRFIADIVRMGTRYIISVPAGYNEELAKKKFMTADGRRSSSPILFTIEPVSEVTD